MGQITSEQQDMTNSAMAFASRWQAVNSAGDEIGVMAALAPEVRTPELVEFPNKIAASTGAHATLAREALADLDAILQPGLTALRAIKARGQDTTAPALTLWREFHALRTALLALAPVNEEHEAAVAA